MADVVSNILLNMRANTTQARLEVGKLAGAQKDAAKAVLKAQEEQNLSLQSQIVTWGKVAGAIGIAVGAYKVLSAAAKEYAKEERLRAATVGIDIDKIQKATMGLITSDEALAFAAKGVTGAFKLTQEQMELVAKFSVVLRNRGFELTEVQNALGEAFQKGSTRGLKEFGINISESAGTHAAFAAMMAEIAKQANAAGDALARPGDEMVQASTKWADAMDNIGDAAGKMAQSLAPAVNLMADFVTFLAVGNEFEEMRTKAEVIADNRRNDRLNAILGEYNPRPTDLGVFGPELPPGMAPGGTPKSSGGRGRSSGGGYTQSYAQETGRGPVNNYMTTPSLPTEAMESKAMKFDAIPEYKGPSEIEKIIEANKDAAGAFRELQLAGGEAFEALVTGSESFATAFRKSIGSAILGEGALMTAQAIKFAVFALGSLAFGNFSDAAKFGIASAKAGAGAAAMGLLASKLGAGGSSSAGGGGGAMPDGAASGRNASGEYVGSSNVTVITGSDLDDNPRMAANRINKQLLKAKRMLGTSEESTVFA